MKKIFTILGISAAFFMNAQIVINEVYGGGGNSGATLKNDFVELINRGTAEVTLSGAYLQYGSATGVFQGTGSTPLLQALPTITLQPGQTYLIQQAQGSGGTTNLPTPDFVPTAGTEFGMSGTAGKIALTSNSTVVTSATDSNVIDLVGFGSTASIFEGSGPSPAPSNTNSISRTNGVDTNNNAADFTAGAPTPKNSAGVTLGVDSITALKANFVQNTIVNDAIKFGLKSDVKVYNMNGQVVKSAAVEKGSTLNVSSLPKGIYIVTGNIEGQVVSQKITKN